MPYLGYIVLLAVVLGCLTRSVSASVGDRSWIFLRCMDNCLPKECSNMGRFHSKQPWIRHVLRWSCEDECRYSCMWKTVQAFQKDGSPVPQFFGKWPFVRLWGIQEPASVFFSILNFVGHFLIFKFRSKVPSSAPMYYVWHGTALIGFNAWFWSVVFHTRDKDFTEKLDYFSAFSVAMYSLFAMCCRFFGTEQLWKPLLVGAAVLTGYAFHIYYMGWVKFDYSYNMAANVTVGCVVMAGWLAWSLKVRRRRPYVWKMVVFLISMQLLLLLELGDFPPVYWTFDAHSLWHAGTVPLCVLFYSFTIDDSLALLKEKQEREDQAEDISRDKKAV